MSDPFLTALVSALRSTGLESDDQFHQRLLEHWSLLRRWAPRLNLTATESPEEAAWLHYRDSLEALRVLPSGSLVDIGSGAGFPGIVLAAADPLRPVTLVEPRRKRASFLRVAAAAMQLRHVSVLEARADAAAPSRFRIAVTRATFSKYQELSPCLDWLEPAGLLIAFRSEPLESPVPATSHPYELQGRPRLLQMWNKHG